MKDEEFDNVYHKLRGELSSPTQQLIVHYCRERQIPPEVRRRKVYVVRALILGAAIQFENGELTYGEEALQMVHDSHPTGVGAGITQGEERPPHRARRGLF